MGDPFCDFFNLGKLKKKNASVPKRVTGKGLADQECGVTEHLRQNVVQGVNGQELVRFVDHS